MPLAASEARKAAVAADEARFGPAIAGRLMRLFRQSRTAGDRPFPDLSEREFAILELIAQGINNRQIADRLMISGKVVAQRIVLGIDARRRVVGGYSVKYT